MRVEVKFTVETRDFGGQEFKEEIEDLLADIARDACETIVLLSFSMKEEGGDYTDRRAIQWKKAKGEA